MLEFEKAVKQSDLVATAMISKTAAIFLAPRNMVKKP